MAVAAMYRGRAMLAPTSFIKNNGAAAKSQLHRIFVFAPRGENSPIVIIYYFVSIIYNIVPPPTTTSPS
uniref:hypothetical protein n=1 Tax=Gemmiger formicilis TaxID=745368 RepID=UPI004025778F